jgi:hypothetical protein
VTEKGSRPAGGVRRFPTSRQLLLASAILLSTALFLPVWSTRMEAPQYRNEEALQVHVYAGRVKGDVAEIQTLNQYVGVTLPLDTPELHAMPWVLGAMLAAALLAWSLPLSARPPATLLLWIAMTASALGGGALLQYRLYQMGHVRARTILEGVPDFTPPILGSAKIANFTVHMSLGPGGWGYAMALVLVALVFFRAHAEKRTALAIGAGRHEERADSDSDSASRAHFIETEG